ncbi:uncharacterized protein [Primulina eburnea]|uniref:uncharacterized protein n=1 Tax=Primulina eburnea TaxID=1245227 RepID=UPI003C6C9B8D
MRQFGHISTRAAIAKKKLEDVQRVIIDSRTEAADYRLVKRDTEIMLEAERLFIVQKAKINYLKQGDRCTKFFHDLIKRNNKRSALLAIKNTEVPSDQELVKSGNCVQMSDWPALIWMVSVEEIERALHYIDNDKAPGSDGFGALFFKHMWSIIKKDVCEGVFEFFATGKLLR